MPGTSPLSLLLESPLVGLLMFGLFFAAFILVFCRDNVGGFIRGLIRLAGAVFGAPVRYVQAAAARVGEYSKVDPDYRKDQQYLIHTVLMISSAAIILVAIGILAAGSLASWRIFAPESVRLSRAAAAEALPEAIKEVSATEKEVTDLTAKLGTQSPEEKRLDGLRGELSKAKEDLAQKRASLDTSGYPEWAPVLQHLESNGGTSTDWEFERVRNAVTTFVEQRATPNAVEAIKGYLDVWEKTRRLQIQVNQGERNNPRAAMLREKAAADERLAEQKRRVTSLEEQASYARVIKELQPLAAFIALMSGIAAFLTFVWAAGLLVEWTGLLVDLATNVRKLREASERTDAS